MIIAHHESSTGEPVQNAPKIRSGGRSKQIADKVEKAVIELLMQGTINDVTFEAVAKNSGVNRATLRRRWGDKWRLVTWSLLEVMSKEAPAPDTGTLQGDVQAAMLNLSAAFSSPLSSAVAQILFVESRSDEAIRSAAQGYWNQRIDLFKPMIERSIARDELPDDSNFDFVIDIVFGPFFYHLLRTNKPISLEQAQAFTSLAMAVVKTIDLRLYDANHS